MLKSRGTYRPYLFWLLLVVAASAQAQHSVAAVTPEVLYGDAPSWVKPLPLQRATDGQKASEAGGELHLLYDHQVNATLDKPISFNRHVIELHSMDSIERNSQLSFTFSPSYQQLTLHDVHLIRNGQVLDRLHPEAVTLMQRETQLERLIYDGRWTASLVLDDVRQGDLLEYSYSVAGSNPAYAGHWSTSLVLQWRVPLEQHQFRLLWPAGRPLNIQSPEPELLRKVRSGDSLEYSMVRAQVPPLTVDAETPGWYDPFPRLELSSFHSWQDVAQWARPHYRYTQHSSITALANDIARRTTDSKQRASLALRYVQDEIRYLGIEIGMDGYVPTPPEVTLERRYGDCKDKTLLLIALLDALGISSVPVLVNSDAGLSLNTLLPSILAFDHVVVKITINKQDYWVDPTISAQKGTLDTIFQPDYGYVLEVSENTQSLSRPNIDYSYHTKVVNDVFDLTAGLTNPINYTVTTRYQGRYAENTRRWMSTKSHRDLEDDFLDYYDEYYPDIDLREKIEFADDIDNNVFTVVERYSIDADWKKDEDSNRYALMFYTDSMRALIDKPESRRRSSPYALAYPRNERQTVKVLLPTEWSVTADKKEVVADSFRYVSELEYLPDERAIQGTYEFISLSDHISAEGVRRHIRQMDEVYQDLDFYIHHDNPKGPRTSNRRPSGNR